jgi:hypothetical protein
LIVSYRCEVVVSADGKLMPTRKDQPAPDLKYFKPPQKLVRGSRRPEIRAPVAVRSRVMPR